MDQITENRTWAEISRSALRHNLNVAKELTGGTKIMCVIKGNAHGHGAVECGAHHHTGYFDAPQDGVDGETLGVGHLCVEPDVVGVYVHRIGVGGIAGWCRNRMTGRSGSTSSWIPE